jgi:hypothetical protein
MKRVCYSLALIVGLMLSIGAPSVSLQGQDQFPILDQIANKVIQKYQQSTCEQLWQERAQSKNKPRPQKEQELINILRNEPQMRAAFISKVAAPIANKMFECGMIP